MAEYAQSPDTGAFFVDYVPPDILDETWWAFVPYIADALAYSAGEYRASDIREAVEAHRMQLWGVEGPEGIAGAVVTQIINYPRKRILECVLLSGDEAKQWIAQAKDTLEAFARHRDCAMARLKGRPGWVRVMQQHGYQCRYWHLEKQL